ncbi:hypothetical protein GGX14DRAFT_389356 [Mycena pura]|uniref:Uncharacterized protein n=1 Tax=Mycena pura TaxID=153505 RepID=A0AAD6VQC1_9AGAR|nr:hypothetical protein GGX14DRAFT_389356 [Mycena pura]
MHDSTSFAVPESGSAARAHAWIAEAAVERENSHYIPITASWALSALQKYSDPRLQKLERAARRTHDRLAFDAQARLDPLPPQGLQYIAEARHLQRVRYAAGGDTLAASFAVCDARLPPVEKIGLFAWLQSQTTAAHLDWAAAVGEGYVGQGSVEPMTDSGAVECSAADVIEAGADGCSDGPGFMIARTVSPEPWWLGQEGLVPGSEVGRRRRGARRVTASSGKCGPLRVWRQWLRERLIDDFLDDMNLSLVRDMAMPVNAVGAPHAPGHVPPNSAHPKGVAGRELE